MRFGAYLLILNLFHQLSPLSDSKSGDSSITSDEASSAIVLFIALISAKAAVFILQNRVSLQFGHILGVRFTLMLDAVLLRSE